jgi:amino acid transporter
MSLLIYFIPYIYLFVAFIVHCRKRNRNIDEPLVVPGGQNGALIIGLCGLSITVFAMIVAMIPPPGTANTWIHEAKVAGGSLFLILTGLIIYWRARRKPS